MKNTQSINIKKDRFIVIDGLKVVSTIDLAPYVTNDLFKKSVKIYLLNMSVPTGDALELTHSSESIPMTYHANTRCWTIEIKDLIDADGNLILKDDCKYFGSIYFINDSTINSVNIEEFVVDPEVDLAINFQLPYEIIITQNMSKISWYTVASGVHVEKFYAYAYEGGTGKVFSKTPTNITHRSQVFVV